MEAKITYSRAIRLAPKLATKSSGVLRQPVSRPPGSLKCAAASVDTPKFPTIDMKTRPSDP